MNERVTEYQVSALPQDGSARGWGGAFDVHVTWSGIGDLWAVRVRSWVYDADGAAAYERLPSDRDDKFLARFRHDLPTALALAHKIAPGLTVNGTSATQAAAEIAWSRPMA